jgi:two-component system response regulator AtoC
MGVPLAHLLLIDDDPALIPKQLRQAFPAPAHSLQIARTGAKGLDAIRTKMPDVILLDLRLPDQSGLDVYQNIRAIDARIPVIFVTVAKSADVAIKAMQEGAFDYLFKPLDLQQLWQVVTNAIEVSRRMRQPAVLSELPPEPDFNGAIVGTCPSMREVYKAVGRVASQHDPVLITGDTGTGKELVACALYQHSPRAKSPFLALNCAAIPENLLESELFGHEKGAFTGADRRRIGKFEQCNGGTLFLDEIGDMPLPLQAKLLRLLQDQTFERVGGNETIQTDVRLIAATNHDLRQLSATGKFRPDLYYRLSVFTVHVPALRNRGNDLQLLVQLFLRRFSPELGRSVFEVAPETLNRLRKYSWPGNIRELQSVLKQALLLSSGEVLLPEFLPADVFGPWQDAGGASSTPRLFDSGKSLADLECDAIQESLLETGGNRQQTAEQLGISTRTLLRKIRQYSLADPLHKPAATSESQ